MPKFTEEERTLGRAFRSAATAQLIHKNAVDPPDYTPPAFLAIYRHKCSARGDRSTAMQLKEVYLSSAIPIPVEEQQEYTIPTTQEHYDPVPWDGSTDHFAYIYREGRCGVINSSGAVQGGCGQTSRSPVGFFVDAYDRPPLEGKVARSGA